MININKVKDSSNEISDYIISMYEKRLVRINGSLSTTFKLFSSDMFDKTLYKYAKKEINKFDSNISNYITDINEKFDGFASDMNVLKDNALTHSIEFADKYNDALNYLQSLKKYNDRCIKYKLLNNYILEKETSVNAFNNSKEIYQELISKFLEDNDYNFSLKDINLTNVDIDNIRDILMQKGIKEKDATKLSFNYVFNYNALLPKEKENEKKLKISPHKIIKNK